jgi:hypothetical protein
MAKVFSMYAVLNSDDSARAGLPRGIDDEPTYAVAVGALAGVVAELDLAAFHGARKDYPLTEDSWLVRAVRAHDYTVQQVFSQVPVVPLRFGMTFASRAGVEEYLFRRAGHLRDCLELALCAHAEKLGDRDRLARVRTQ